jgi:hypothetical protein
VSLEARDQLICEFCGLEIEEIDQECPALDDGRCRP